MDSGPISKNFNMQVGIDNKNKISFKYLQNIYGLKTCFSLIVVGGRGTLLKKTGTAQEAKEPACQVPKGRDTLLKQTCAAQEDYESACQVPTFLLL